jgi:hypothetical protein
LTQVIPLRSVRGADTLSTGDSHVAQARDSVDDHCGVSRVVGDDTGRRADVADRENGSIAGSVQGSVKVARSMANPTVSQLRISGAVSNCTYNGIAVPFAGGASRTVAVGNPAKWCDVLNQGGTITRSVTRVVAFGHVIGVVSGTGTLSPATPSGSAPYRSTGRSSRGTSPLPSTCRSKRIGRSPTSAREQRVSCTAARLRRPGRARSRDAITRSTPAAGNEPAPR